MRTHIMIIPLVTLLNLAAIHDVSAQQGMTWHGSGGWGPHSPYGMMYNNQTMEEASGEVVTVDKISMMHQMQQQGVHLTVKAGQDTLSVHLGPAWYLEKQDVKIMPGDKVTIKGSRITFDDEPTLIAAEIRKGDQVLILRDSDGIPVWSGWRQRQ
ncbi:DNA-binding protein [Photobacterium ganghwense]|uniref:DNA-binding protein n=1 Tax=Photobacterium ganghwense TaxID=320778 RepID=A0A0J1HEU5_9GAMM|nr:hypothetical protein [Photobacterium ganghwense]KLV10169.1 DNA-binding protein [Photobacterium ganghwense]PSU05418.1 DNA-binding protein [Photobacterium ganghwense]